MFLRLFPALGLAAAFAPLASAQTSAGQLYTLTNEASGNRVAVYDRAADGALTFDEFVSTGGAGTDGGLGNQGAVILTSDERFLIAVNAGSHNLSVFRVLESGLALVDVEPAVGLEPISVTQHDGIVFAVNAGTSSISGFELGFDGDLTYIGGSAMRLSAATTGPAQITFGPRGEHLYVTEKATNSITRMRLNPDARPIMRRTFPSPGATPFGFAFGLRGQMIVSEAEGGAPMASTVTSYLQQSNGDLTPVTTSLGAGQSAACWIVNTPDGRVAYATNTADDTVSSFSIGFDGALTVLEPVAATVGDGPTDMAVTRDGRFFYVLNARDGSVGDYAIGADGSLTGIPGSTTALPMGRPTGLAVR